jgi:hypothetical protein
MSQQPADGSDPPIDPPTADQPPDGPQPEGPQPDDTQADGPQADGTQPDVAQPDAAQPNEPPPYGAQPAIPLADAPPPEMPPPGAARPDVPPPYAAQPDAPQLYGAQPDAPRAYGAQPDGSQPYAAEVGGAAGVAVPWVSPGGVPEVAPVAVAAPAAPRPPAAERRAVELRPLGLGELLDGSLGAFRRNAGVVLGITVPLVTLQQTLVLVLQLTVDRVPTNFTEDDIPTTDVLGLLITLGVGAVIGTILNALLIVLVAEDALGRRRTALEAWRRVRGRLLPLIAVSLVTTVLIAAGLFLLVAPGLALWTWWALITPAMLLERLGPIAAIRRSVHLVRTAAWQVLGVQLVAFLLGLFLLYVIALPFAILGEILAELGSGTGPGADLTVLGMATLGSIAGGVVARPFRAGVLALLYVDRRIRSEGLDLSLRLQARRARQAPAPAEPTPDVPAHPLGALQGAR